MLRGSGACEDLNFCKSGSIATDYRKLFSATETKQTVEVLSIWTSLPIINAWFFFAASTVGFQRVVGNSNYSISDRSGRQ